MQDSRFTNTLLSQKTINLIVVFSTVQNYKLYIGHTHTHTHARTHAHLYKGSLSPTQQNRRYYTHASGKTLPRDQLEHLRPITLLNTDDKTLAKALSVRLSKATTTLVAEGFGERLSWRAVTGLFRSTLTDSNAAQCIVELAFFLSKVPS